MNTQELFNKEGLEQQRVMSFIEGMHDVKFAGPKGSLKDLDTFLLVTYNRTTKQDEVDFISWAKNPEDSNDPENPNDPSRSFPYNFISSLRLLELPKGKDHAPYPQSYKYYENELSKLGNKVPVIAFGSGPTGRNVLYRLKGMSTKESFERLKQAAGL